MNGILDEGFGALSGCSATIRSLSVLRSGRGNGYNLPEARWNVVLTDPAIAPARRPRLRSPELLVLTPWKPRLLSAKLFVLLNAWKPVFPPPKVFVLLLSRAVSAMSSCPDDGAEAERLASGSMRGSVPHALGKAVKAKTKT